MEISTSLTNAKSALYYQKKKERELQADPELMDLICAHVADGGSLAWLCERQWRVNYGRMSQWVNSDQTRRDLLSRAHEARLEWERERILSELRTLSFFDIRDILGPDGCVLPPSEWPDHISRAVESMDVQEMWGQAPDGTRVQTGVIKKVKLTAKLKALELIGKTSAMFVERHEHTIKPMTLGEMVAASYLPEKDVTPEGSKA